MTFAFCHVRRLLFFVLLLGCVAQSSAQASWIIGTFDTTRATTGNVATGPFGDQRRASLFANFPGATYATAPTLTPEFLATVDSVSIAPAMTDTIGITPLSASEQSALLGFVQGGGSAFLVADGFTPFTVAAQSMLTPFGLTIVDDGLSGTLVGSPTVPSHPIISGPFGNTTQIALFGAGVLTNLGPNATSLAKMNANNLPILAVIERNVLGPGSGPVVIISDSTMFVDNADGGFFSTHETLYLNIVQFLIPEPGSIALGGTALGALLLVAAKRRRLRTA